MSRLPPLLPEELSAEQRRVSEEIGAARGGAVAGPFAVWLRTPAIADAANRFGNVLRTSRLDPRLLRLMSLIVARAWTAQYEWYAQVKHAPRVGLSAAVVEAIRDRRVPPFERDDERVVYELVTQLLETHDLLPATYDRAVAQLGLEATIELVSGIGFYTSIAIVIKAFDAPVPGDERPLP
jgi:4-carboxymuconolactone decarboxylase